MTFTINIGTDTEAKYRGFDSILNDLYDNDVKYINPKYIRDAVLYTYEESVLKPTDVSGVIKYIGIDSEDPSNRDTKLKHFYGKRSFGGQDIMNTTLLDRSINDTDIFFYNTKEDTDVNINSTKLSFLAGSDFSLFDKAPYIKSTILDSSATQGLDIVNKNGDINISSTSHNVNIDGVKFPLMSETPSNNDLMYWNSANDRLEFKEFTYSVASISSTGPVNLLSANSFLNGYSLEFTDTTPLPKTWNDNLPMGSINVDESINTMLYKLIYEYLPPLVDLYLCSPYDSGYIEIGMNILVPIKYTITKRTNKIVNINLTNMISSTQLCPIIDDGFLTQSGNLNGVLTSGSTTNDFTLTVIDDYDPPATVSDTVTLNEVYPYFNGFGTSVNSLNLNTYDKIIEPEQNQKINIFGSGDYYFVYDSTYGDLVEILDETGTDVISSSTISLVILTSPDAYWGSKEFKCYKISSVNITIPGEFYEFKFTL
tara:strand:- start:10 stop:1458 length:1449 start_codon:yes stop_codon:yes gene_type:complete